MDLSIAVTIICSVLASSGFWAFIQTKRDSKDVKTQMLLGLAHDRIIYLGMCYIKREFISNEEYENLRNYLYAPYEKMGGNGVAKRIMCEIDKLPIRAIPYEPCSFKQD